MKTFKIVVIEGESVGFYKGSCSTLNSFIIGAKGRFIQANPSADYSKIKVINLSDGSVEYEEI